MKISAHSSTASSIFIINFNTVNLYEFINVTFIFCSCSLRMRKDLRDIFDQIRAGSNYSVTQRKSNDSTQNINSRLQVPRVTLEQAQGKKKNVFQFY